MKTGTAISLAIVLANGIVSAAPPAKTAHESSRIIVVVRATFDDGDRVRCNVLHPATFARTSFSISDYPTDYRPIKGTEKWCVSVPHEVVAGLKDLTAYERRVKRQVDAGIDPLMISDCCIMPSVQYGRVSVRRMPEKKAEPGATDNPDDAQRLREDH